VQIGPGGQRTALIVWIVAAAAGSAGVWYLSSYLEGLTSLAQSDPEAALSQFRSRVLPALVLVVAIAVAAGATLMRQGLHLVNRVQGGEDLPDSYRGRGQRSARTVGSLLAAAGFVLAAVPLVLLSIVLWYLRKA
jgi:hypothetical protein